MDEELKICNECGIPQTLNNFYIIGKDNKRRGKCKHCLYKERERKLFFISDYPNPNTFRTEYERETVSQFLTALGWLFSEEHNKWYKPGFVTPEGTWIEIERRNERHQLELDRRTNKLYSDKIIQYVDEHFDYKIDKIRYFIHEGYTFEDINLRYKVTQSQYDKLKNRKKPIPRFKKKLDLTEITIEDKYKEIELQILKLHNEGLTPTEILPLVDCSISKVYSTIRKYKI